MKNYLFLLFTLLIVCSCAKQEEIILEQDLTKIEKNYFPIGNDWTFYYESQGNEDNQLFSVESYHDFLNYERIGNVQLDKSYLYGGLGGSYESYYEIVFVKKSNEDLMFRIEESHSSVYPSYSSSYDYEVDISPYELTLLKENMTLNQTWTTSQQITLSYDGRYSYFPPISDETTTSVFNYEVIELGGTREINNNNYYDLVTIKVIYNIGSYNNLERTYTFSNDIGLVAFSIKDKIFYLQ